MRYSTNNTTGKLNSPSMWTRAYVVILVVFGMSVPQNRLCHAVENPNNATSKIKNVLFIVSDDLRADALGCYGNTVCKTPNIDSIARQGVVFERAYCQGTWCAPSRRSFMYGKYLGKSSATIGEHFIKNNYYSARVGKIFHMRVPGDIIDGTNGPDVAECWTERFNSPGREAHTPGAYACLNLNIFTRDPENRQSTAMPHRMFVTVQQDGDGTDQPDFKTASKAIELLREHGDKPFFLAVGLIRPHYPMVAPPKYFEAYPWEKMSLPEQIENDIADIPQPGRHRQTSKRSGIDKFPDNQKRMWQGYYASVSFMDDQVGRLLAELDKQGLRESTAIVFISDHGYHLGEHTFWEKSTMHERVTRVPMIISVPGYSTGKTDSFVELVDLYPTFADLTGLEIPDDIDGNSLVPILKDPNASVKECARAFNNKGQLYRNDRWAFIQYKNGSCELYDMQNDPNQYKNLAVVNQSEATNVINELRKRLVER